MFLVLELFFSSILTDVKGLKTSKWTDATDVTDAPTRDWRPYASLTPQRILGTWIIFFQYIDWCKGLKDQ